MDAIAELSQEERVRRRQVRTDAELFVQLLKHPAWPRYMALIETVAQNHHTAVMKPVESVLESTRIEYHKGVLNGLSAASMLPQMKIQEAHELRPVSRDEEE